MEIAPPNSKVNLESLWRSGDRPFYIGGECPLPAVLLADDFYPERGCAVEPLPTGREYAFPLVKIMLLVLQRIREARDAVLLVEPKWPNQPWFPELVNLSSTPNPPMADSAEKGFIVHGEGRNMAPPAEIMRSACVASQYGVNQLTVSQRVLHTITEATAPTTRHLYDLKRRVFAYWCVSRHEDPISCNIPAVLTSLFV